MPGGDGKERRFTSGDSGVPPYPPLEIYNPSIVYIDESGDHNPIKEKGSRVLVLAFCLFNKEAYLAACARIQQFKFRYFGHNAVVLHRHEIQGSTKAFADLQENGLGERFRADLTELIAETDFKLIASAIDKRRIRVAHDYYERAMKHGLERLDIEYGLRSEKRPIHLVCESRNKRQDDLLRKAFEKQCDGDIWGGHRLSCRLVFAPKNRCHAGMEIADFLANPIARYVLDPTKPSAEWPVIESKLRKDAQGKYLGIGLKIFP